MTTFYNHNQLEKKWQDKWAESDLSQAKDGQGKKKYILDMFAYPSAEGLHVGHPESYTATDIVSRYHRLNGYNVLHPIGFDSFGLPTENYAIKKGVHPQIKTQENIKNFRRQIKSLGFSYDWSREVITSSPEYYKWTQWLFLELYKKGLAYKKKAPVNWCDSCKTVLANEQVVDGKCERCENEVIQKDLEQWFFRITDYAEELLEKIDEMDWSEALKSTQKNWIGRSDGVEIVFKIKDQRSKIKVFTTRPDTLFGATYMVIAPEHAMIKDLRSKITNWNEVEKYIKKSKTKSRLERTDLAKEKTGVELKGIKAINPANNQEIPIFMADYVMMGYGTGAIMAVPAHDLRDYEFAKKYNLEIKQVIAPFFTTTEGPDAVRSDKPTVKRQTAYSFVKHWQEDKYLCLDWEKFNWHSGIIGGVKDGEDMIEAAKREIQEETGYKNIRFIKELCGEHYCHYFAGHKNENRYATGHCFLFKLIDGAYKEPDPEETKNHKTVWIDKDKMSQFLNLSNFQFIWEQYQKNISCYTGEGKLINSDKFDGLLSEKAKDKITKLVSGEKKVQYKIRDWLISRQRYWGAPIPIIYCDNCKDKEQVLILHGWEGSSKSDFIPALKKNLKDKGYEVFAFDAPNTAVPKFEEWFSFIEKKIKENKLKNFHVVGHSMGGHLAFKLAEKYKINKLVAVAPVGFNSSEEYFRQFKGELTDEEMAVFKDYQSHNLNVEAVKKNVKEISFIFGGQDPWITKDIVRFYSEQFSEAKVKILPNAKHMSGDEGVKELPELEEMFEKIVPSLIPVPEKDLPVKLPDDVDFKPTGESPLVRSKSFHKVKCPKCGASARRESDTMDTFVCSSWYFLRYCDAHNQKEAFSKKSVKYWMPVDLYIGGMEHAVGHLIYARFIVKALRDLGYLKFDEPFLKIRNQGIILAEDGRKMSKRWGNVINPDDVVEQYGADTLRMYEMFMGPLEDSKPWDQKGIIGVRRFLQRINDFIELYIKNKEELKNIKGKSKLIHKTIKGVTEDIEKIKFNTAISKMMIFFNERDFGAKISSRGIFESKDIDLEAIEKFLIILSPFAPHLSEELWESLGHKESIFSEKWPEYDKKLVVDEEVTIAVQVNGKLRDTIKVERGISEEDLRTKIEDLPKVKKYIEGKEIRKFIYIEDKLVNIVV